MRTGLLVFAGILAPLVYAAAVVLGGWLTPGYSHASQPISALIMGDAPAASVLDPIFTLYNALVILFAFAVGRAFRGFGFVVVVLVPAFLVLLGLAGILLDFYPMDPIGAVITYGGRVHLWLAGLASLSTVLAVLLSALALRNDPAWGRFAGYSLVSVIVIVFSGGFAALAAARHSPVMGLWERVTIGAFLLWMLVLALTLVRRGRS